MRRSVQMGVMSVCVMFLMIEKNVFEFSVGSIDWFVWRAHVYVCVIAHNFRFAHRC